MKLSEFEGKLLSYPVKVHWAGWESNTYALQQQGWSFSADQNIASMTMAVAMSHPQFGHGYSNYIPWEYFEDYRRGYTGGYAQFPELHMAVMGRPVNFHVHGTVDWAAFKPIDATPQFLTDVREPLDRLVHFAPALARTQEIIVPEESVPELLERILKLQQPERTERIKDRLKNPQGYLQSALPQQKFHAQIMSLTT